MQFTVSQDDDGEYTARVVGFPEFLCGYGSTPEQAIAEVSDAANKIYPPQGHSAEPWRLDAKGNYVTSDDRDIVWIHPDDDAWHRCTELCTKAAPIENANARRIVACVNFCREFDTEYLEAHQPAGTAAPLSLSLSV